jgi:hypothetical protein
MNVNLFQKLYVPDTKKKKKKKSWKQTAFITSVNMDTIQYGKNQNGHVLIMS